MSTVIKSINEFEDVNSEVTNTRTILMAGRARSKLGCLGDRPSIMDVGHSRALAAVMIKELSPSCGSKSG